MKKILLVVLITLICLVSICGCDNQENYTNQIYEQEKATESIEHPKEDLILIKSLSERCNIICSNS